MGEDLEGERKGAGGFVEGIYSSIEEKIGARREGS